MINSGAPKSGGFAQPYDEAVAESRGRDSFLAPNSVHNDTFEPRSGERSIPGSAREIVPSQREEVPMGSGRRPFADTAPIEADERPPDEKPLTFLDKDTVDQVVGLKSRMDDLVAKTKDKSNELQETDLKVEVLVERIKALE